MRTRDVAGLLDDADFVADLDEPHRDVIAGCGRMRRFRRGDLLLAEGGEAEEFHLIRHGTVALEVAAPGRAPLVVATLAPGELVGASWLFPPYRWSFDARAREPVATIGFDAPCLRRKCEQDPAMGYALTQRLARIWFDRLQATRLQLLDLYGDPA